MACQDEMQYEYEDENAAGPSGTYLNPLRQDSVIPNDTQTQKDMGEENTPGKTAFTALSLSDFSFPILMASMSLTPLATTSPLKNA